MVLNGRVSRLGLQDGGRCAHSASAGFEWSDKEFRRSSAELLFKSGAAAYGSWRRYPYSISRLQISISVSHIYVSKCSGVTKPLIRTPFAAPAAVRQPGLGGRPSRCT